MLSHALARGFEAAARSRGGLRAAARAVRLHDHLPRAVPGAPRSAAAAAPAGARHRQPALAGLGGAHDARPAAQAGPPRRGVGRRDVAGAARPRTGRWPRCASPEAKRRPHGAAGRGCSALQVAPRWRPVRRDRPRDSSRTWSPRTARCGSDEPTTPPAARRPRRWLRGAPRDPLRLRIRGGGGPPQRRLRPRDTELQQVHALAAAASSPARHGAVQEAATCFGNWRHASAIRAVHDTGVTVDQPLQVRAGAAGPPPHSPPWEAVRARAALSRRRHAEPDAVRVRAASPFAPRAPDAGGVRARPVRARAAAAGCRAGADAAASTSASTTSPSDRRGHPRACRRWRSARACARTSPT